MAGETTPGPPLFLGAPSVAQVFNVVEVGPKDLARMGLDHDGLLWRRPSVWMRGDLFRTMISDKFDSGSFFVTESTRSLGVIVGEEGRYKSLVLILVVSADVVLNRGILIGRGALDNSRSILNCNPRHE